MIFDADFGGCARLDGLHDELAADARGGAHISLFQTVFLGVAEVIIAGDRAS